MSFPLLEGIFLPTARGPPRPVAMRCLLGVWKMERPPSVLRVVRQGASRTLALTRIIPEDWKLVEVSASLKLPPECETIILEIRRIR